MKTLRRYMLLLKLYCYWYALSISRRYMTVAIMFITREKRLYYLYSTLELVEINAHNYLKRVKVDAKEFAIIETANVQGEITLSKAERF